MMHEMKKDKHKEDKSKKHEEHKDKMKKDPKSKQVSVGREKIDKVMHEYGMGELHSGSKMGPKVTSPRQAVAIAYSEAKRSRKKKK